MSAYKASLESLRERLFNPLEFSSVERRNWESLFTSDELFAINRRENLVDETFYHRMEQSGIEPPERSEVVRGFIKKSVAALARHDGLIRIALGLEKKARELLGLAQELRRQGMNNLMSMDLLYDEMSDVEKRCIDFPQRPFVNRDGFPRMRRHWSWMVFPNDLSPDRVALLEAVDRKLSEL